MKKAPAWLVAAGSLAGCAGPALTSTLSPAGPPPSLVGVAGPVVAADQVEPELTRVQTLLEERIGSQDWGIPVQLSRSAEGFLRVRVGADESFDPGASQLAAQALMLYAELAEIVKGSAVVTHVLVHGDAATDDVATDLTARRADAIQSDLASRGVLPTRVRAEGRANAQPATAEPDAGAINRRVEIVLKPVVAGQEALAWAPPP